MKNAISICCLSFALGTNFFAWLFSPQNEAHIVMANLIITTSLLAMLAASFIRVYTETKP